MHKAWEWLIRNYRDYHDLLAIGMISVLANLGYGILNVSAIPPYAKQRGWAGQIGVIYAVYLVAEALARGPTGALGDRIGRKPMFIGAAIVGAVTSFLWTAIPVLWIILIVHAFDGFMFAVFYTATVVAMTESVGPERRTTAMTAFVVTLMAGMSVGPVIGGFANEATHSKLTSFYITSAVFVGAALVASHYFPAGVIRSEAEAESRGRIKSVLAGIRLALRSIPGDLVLAVFIYFPAGLAIPIAKLFAMSVLNFTEGEFGIVFVVGAVAVGAFAFLAAWVTKTWSKVRVVQLGMIMGMVSAYLFVFVRGVWPAVIFGGGMVLAYVLAVPAWMAYYTDIAELEVRGSIVGVMGFGQGVGLIAGVVLGGYFYHSVAIDVDGFRIPPHYMPFLAMALGFTLAVALSFLLVKATPDRCISVEESYGG